MGGRHGGVFRASHLRHAGRVVACVHLGASGYGRRLHRVFLRVGEPLSPCGFRFGAHMDARSGALSHHSRTEYVARFRRFRPRPGTRRILVHFTQKSE